MKSRKICAALVAVFSLVSVSAHAEWIQVNEKMAYNTERIQINGPIRTAFVRVNGSREVNGEHYDYTISRDVINCKDWASASRSITAYRSDGAVVASATYQPYETVPRPIIPDSYEEGTAKAVCAIR